MNSLAVVLIITLCSVYGADINGTSVLKDLKGCSYSATCSASGTEGVCVSKSGGCCSGTLTSGLCPGSSDVQCCTNNPCHTPWGDGSCIKSSDCNGGDSFTGYCTGPSEIQCCVGGTGGGGGGGGGGSTGSIGVDISQKLDSSTASCFKSNGVDYIVPRGYQSSGHVDPNVCASLAAAQSAGITKRDVYLFPCPTCSTSPAQQVADLVAGLQGCAWSGRIWLDIEGQQYWLGSASANQDWYKQLVDACKSQTTCGVYGSANAWSTIFGSTSFSYGSDLPLWYPHYDNSASFSDFSSFGGWSSPYAKQYQGDVTLCGFGVDMDYTPSSF